MIANIIFIYFIIDKFIDILSFIFSDILSDISIKTRRRMARERRGAGSSLVSMETQF